MLEDKCIPVDAVLEVYSVHRDIGSPFIHPAVDQKLKCEICGPGVLIRGLDLTDDEVKAVEKAMNLAFTQGVITQRMQEEKAETRVPHPGGDSCDLVTVDVGNPRDYQRVAFTVKPEQSLGELARLAAVVFGWDLCASRVDIQDADDHVFGENATAADVQGPVELTSVSDTV